MDVSNIEDHDNEEGGDDRHNDGGDNDNDEINEDMKMFMLWKIIWLIGTLVF